MTYIHSYGYGYLYNYSTLIPRSQTKQGKLFIKLKIMDIKLCFFQETERHQLQYVACSVQRAEALSINQTNRPCAFNALLEWNAPVSYQRARNSQFLIMMLRPNTNS